MFYLIDTNHASAFMSDQQPVTDRITAQANLGERFFLSMPTVGELYFAVFSSKRQQQNMLNLRRLLERIAVLPFDTSTAREYGRIRAELKAKGRPIPGVDAQIAAVARVRNLTVLTADRHFDYIDGLAVENWLS
ncbi:PIN domain-containing protein [bacterium]|nr:PIN domain-containing protein [bacterium]